jgi:transglutaminase-like putative cysteine protease
MRVLLDVLLAAAIAAVTLLGVWTSSSLAAYLNGPLWLAGLAGLLLFPVLPLAWEAWSARRRARRRVDDARPRMFGFGERVILRTLVLNLAFLGALLVRFPHSALAALSTRGDWFLDGRAGPGAERARGDVFTLASGLEWLYQALRDDPYRDQLPDPPQTETTPEPAPVATTVPPAPREQGPAPAAPAEAPRPLFAADGTPLWPWPNVLHPLVAALPPEAETSVASVARHLTAGEPNPWLRVKALHDYVADRVAYDVEAYRTRRIPPQDAETVFRTRRSVCAGYANLLAALGAAAGIEIVVVGGDARLEGSDVTGEAHAWNAAKVNGRWALLDPTWNSGYVRDDRFVKQYETEYLFAPPEVQGVSHFPDDAVWQLRTPPLSRGEFFRQPMMRARFYAHGLRLRSPERSQVTVEGRLQVVLENPQQQFLLGRFVPREGGTGGDCRVENGPEARLDCDFPREGTYRVEMFVSPQQYGTYHEVGELEVVSRGAS